MKYLLFFIFSVGAFYSVPAQNKDSVKLASSGGPEIWLDYGKLALYATDFESKIEGGLSWRIGRHWAPAIAIGTAKLTPGQAISNGNYSSEGWYFRAGIEFYQAINEKNRLILGGRYGKSNYQEAGSYIISSTLWPDLEQDFSRHNLSAQWAEFVIGSEMTLYKEGDSDQLVPSRWKLGGYFSVRYMISYEAFEPFNTYAIPGYGRTIDQSTPALQLYIKYSIHK